jgi:diadenosine tetraphosphate (Ap4A) HIT family hydrolase
MVNNAFADLLGTEFAAQAILAATRAASVIPSVGALAAGHVLVIPNEHRLNLVLVPADELAELAELAAATYRTLRATYHMPVIAFEHGSLDDWKRSGGCLDHAHLHLLPLGAEFQSKIAGFPGRWRAVDERGVLDVAAGYIASGSGYLSLWDGHKWWLRSGEVRAQELRRSIAAAQGTPDRWDWAAFPNTDLMRRTVADLAGAIAIRPSDAHRVLFEFGSVPEDR